MQRWRRLRRRLHNQARAVNRTAWDIIEAKLDGSEERILVDDGWVNWLPVYSPGGDYIVYLKSVPHTAVHLMTRAGQDLGRLIPGGTRIRYIDWK